MKRVRLLAAIMIVGFLLGACATAPTARTPYNSGVDAYRAKDYKSARIEWRKAAATGDTSAMNNLGYLLSEGLGGGRDDAEAIELWTSAAKQDHSEAAFHLGRAYETGAGVAESEIEAYAWYTCAAASARAAGPDDHTETSILNDVNAALSALMTSFKPENFAAAQEMAGHYLEAYARK
jgi:TPR repeat protein